ncbi:MAG: orotidine-5'-phosphate decarboxylase [bacterium]|nr:orotidine-5'-phosphate decarboxylase [bacterium]
MEPKDRLIIALDTKDIAGAERILDETSHLCNIFKIGPGLFIKEGRDIVEAVKERGKSCFLDLKLFDIPNTVLSALESAAALNVDIITLHILGGEKMLRSVVACYLRPKLLLGVTILTSFDEQEAKRLGINLPLSDTVIELANLGNNCGLDGVVCSGAEVSQIKELFGGSLLTCVPGIRMKSSSDDQKRVVTPEYAIANGADYIVIGRPILEADSPREVVSEIVKRIEKASL